MDKKPLYILCLAILPLMICSGMVYSVLALYISEELGASRTHIGLIFMTGSLAGAIIAPFFGKLSDKVGRRPILIAAMAGFTLVFLLYALIRDTLHAYPVQAAKGLELLRHGAWRVRFAEVKRSLKLGGCLDGQQAGAYYHPSVQERWAQPIKS